MRLPSVLRRVLVPVIGVATVAALAPSLLPAPAAWSAPNAPSGRVIVKFADAEARDPGARGRILRATSARSGTRLSESRVLTGDARLVTVQGETSESAAARLSKIEGVEYAVVDRFVRTSIARPTSSYYGHEQWSLARTAAGINLPDAAPWANGAGVRVAVVDTGKLRHPDLDAAWLGGHDFVSDPEVSMDGTGRDTDPSDDGDAYAPGECGVPWGEVSSWHGSHVAGTVAARGVGIDGIAPASRIVPVRVLGKCGGYESDIIEGIAWAAGGRVEGVPANRYPARIVNVSIGGYAPCTEWAAGVLRQTRDAGALVVVSAGNDAASTADTWPTNCGSVLPVAATDRTGALWEYSNHGSAVALSAPGVGIVSVSNFGQTRPTRDAWRDMDGTSMAAPHVSGVAALVLQRRPSLTVGQLEAILRASTKPVRGATSDCCGTGIIDAKRAIDHVVPPTLTAKWASMRSTLGPLRSIKELTGRITWASFAHGDITDHPTHGAHATHGRIGAEFRRLGGADVVGVATSDEQRGRAGHLQSRFGKGWILYSGQGAHLLSGDRLVYWTRLSGTEVTTLGQLRTGTVTYSASGTSTAFFTNGAIVSSSAGTFWMHSAVYRRHQALPAATRTALKGLTAAETAGLIPGQRVSRFTGGAIYYAGDTGAWAVTNEIDRRYRATGVATALGNPKGLARSVRFGARKAGFAKGTIYAHSSSGVWEVHGAIGRAFDAAGAENSRLELPTSGEIRSGSTVYQKFRGGRITYAGGKATIRYT